MNLPLPHDRGFVLTVAIVALVPAFAVAHGIVGRYKTERERLTTEWAARGDRDVDRDAAAAVVDYQTALVYGGGEDVELRLAEALNAAGRLAEARAHLLTLWADQPGNGDINLQLARVAAAEGDVDAAVRSYHAAVDGAWESHAASSRRQARLELARLLLGNGQRVRAQAELIALADDLPADANVLTDVGKLVLEAGADNRALALFERALSIDPGNARAAVLAGGVEFRAGDDVRARAFLEQAAKRGPLAPDAREMLDLSTRVLALDPDRGGGGARGRARRALRDLAIARERLDRCQSGSIPAADVARATDLASRAAILSKTAPRAIDRDPDFGDRAMALTFEIEALPAAGCGPDTTDDRALQLLARTSRAPSR